MDDRRSQFLIMIGEIGRQARLASLPVEVTTRDRRAHYGVPDAFEAFDEEVDGTGLAPGLRVDGETVSLRDVVEIRIASP